MQHQEGKTTSAGIVADLKSLGRNTAIYGLGSILVRALSFLLLPVYTRYLSPEDYGIVALTTAIVGVLGIIYPLSLHGALTRLYTDASDENTKRQVAGTLWLATLLSGGAFTVLLLWQGASISATSFRGVSFDPYLKFCILISFFNVFPLLPTTLLQTKEQPVAYVLLTGGPAVLGALWVLYEVVVKQSGARGYLAGTLYASAFSALPCILIALRQGRMTIRWSVLRPALSYSWPLIVHLLAVWILVLSDRVILEHYTPIESVGLYGLAYQFGQILSVGADAMNFAWSPFLFRVDAKEGLEARSRIARLATYFVFVLAWAGLGVALFSREMLLILFPRTYHGAFSVLPWLVGAMFFRGLYRVAVNGLYVKSKTSVVPIITVVSAGLSVMLNILLVPQHGFVAAGWVSFAVNAIFALATWYMSQKYFPVPYEYSRLLRIFLVGGAVFAAGGLVSSPSLGVTGIAHGILWLAFPLLLAISRFFSAGELKKIRSLLAKGRSG